MARFNNIEEETRLRDEIARRAQQYLRKFVKVSIELYDPEFAVFNVHLLIHAADDYLHFGPLDKFSAFRFESFNGRLKKYIHSRFKPERQLMNVYSGRLLTGQFVKDIYGELENFVAEYYEKPELRKPIPELDGTLYERYAEMWFHNFVIHTDNKSDCHCLVNGCKFIRLTKILRNIETGEIVLEGKYFQSIRPIFTSPCSPLEIGIVLCSNISNETFRYPISELSEKLFIFSMSDNEGSIEYAAVQYLH